MQNQSLPALDQLVCLLITSTFPVTVSCGRFFINNIPAELFLSKGQSFQMPYRETGNTKGDTLFSQTL
jgi:hypothetical protein